MVNALVWRLSTFTTLGIVGVVIPLVFIGVAILYSPWFDVANNALSDLGHAMRSSAASIFNLGLCLGGFIVGTHAVYYMINVDKLFGLLLTSSGFNLILIAVFDEVYGTLHFIVSVIFFLMLAVFLVVYSIRFKSVTAIAAVIISLVIWFLHFVCDIPKGAAIPELVSIAAFITYYIKLLTVLRGSIAKQKLS